MWYRVLVSSWLVFLQIYGVSWEGQILCCLDIIAVPSAPPRGGSALGPRSSADRARLADLGAISCMSFNDTLQVRSDEGEAEVD